MKRIAVLTSGGDAPGMNAAIRAVVRTATAKGWEVLGICSGFKGLIEGQLRSLGARDVGEIMQRGGTVLGSARCEAFRSAQGRDEALDRLQTAQIDALVVIGGNGSQTGSHFLHAAGYPVVGIASTIDNDLYGTEVSIGVDTALNVALDAIDRLKVTASSHQRAFLVEVMGRKCGYIALMAAIAGGAEAVVLPEMETTPEELAVEIRNAYKRGKPHAIVVVAEGSQYNAHALTQYFEEHRERLGYELRSTVLGYVQRGSSPTYADRMLATRLGAWAVECIAEKCFGVLVGLKNGQTAVTDLSEVVACRKPLDMSLLGLAGALAT